MPTSHNLTPRVLFLLCLTATGWSFSFGLGATLAPLWLQDHGWKYATPGVNTGIYYGGIAVTAGFVPWLLRRWGLHCVTVGCLLSAVTVALFPWGQSLLGYHLLRLLNGAAGALSLIPLETYVNRDSPAHCRSRNFGFYALAIASGWAIGDFVGLEMYREVPHLAFLVAGAVAVAAAVPIVVSLGKAAVSEAQPQGPAPLQVRRNFFSFGSGWCQGFLEGGMVGLMPLYLRHLDVPEERAGWILGGTLLGVLLFQLPIAWLADRFGRTRALVGCHVGTLAGLCLLPFCGDSAWLVSWLLLVGACSSAFYPLGLTLLGERLPSASVARASALFLAVNCVGSIMGPVITGTVMEWVGEAALFVTGTLAVALIPAAWLYLRWKDAAPAAVPVSVRRAA
jgi:MFS family permease